MGHRAEEVLTLSYVPAPATSDEEPVTIYLARDSTNVTVSLLCNMIYEVTLFATSCGGSLRSENISINIISPGCLGAANSG